MEAVDRGHEACLKASEPKALAGLQGQGHAPAQQWVHVFDFSTPVRGQASTDLPLLFASFLMSSAAAAHASNRLKSKRMP